MRELNVQCWSLHFFLKFKVLVKVDYLFSSDAKTKNYICIVCIVQIKKKSYTCIAFADCK